jgi:hypothetical protein
MFSFNKNRKGQPRQRRGQNVTEYLILLAGVLVVIIVAASPGGIFTQGVNKALNMMSDSVASCAVLEDPFWGGAWVDYGGCETYNPCKQRQIQNTCINPCLGLCSGAYPTQDVACLWPCCGNDVCETGAGEDCDTCPADCGAC